MATNEITKEKCLEMDVCLINEADVQKKLAGVLAASKVHMINMSIKVDTGCSELALPKSLVDKLNLNYVDTVQVSSSTDNNVPINLYGMVIIYWEGLTTTARAYCMPSLDAPLLGLAPLYQFRPEFDWPNNSLKLSVFSFPQKRYHINFNEIDKVIGSDDKIEYFAKEHQVTLQMKNEGGSKMVLIICANRLDVNIDRVAETVSHFAPSLKPI
jgi:clan AA aspartic protease